MTAIKSVDCLFVTPVLPSLTGTPDAGFSGLPVPRDDGLYYTKSDGSQIKLGPKDVYHFNAGSAGMNISPTINTNNTWTPIHKWTNALPSSFKAGQWWVSIVFVVEHTGLVIRIGQRLSFTGADSFTRSTSAHVTSGAATNLENTAYGFSRIPFAVSGAYDIEFQARIINFSGIATLSSIQIILWQIEL